MTDIAIRDFKSIAATLGRFADIRETAKAPRDRILLQVAGGRLKFVAGDDNRSVVVDAGPAEGRAKCIVRSRELLSAAKALRGRGSVSVEVEDSGTKLRLDNGANTRLLPFGAMAPGFVRPIKRSEATGSVSHDGLGVASKLFPTVTSKNHPADKVYLTGGRDNLTLTATDERSFARWDLAPQTTVTRRKLGSVPSSAFRALSDLSQPGVIAWGSGRLTIRSGIYLVGIKADPFLMPWDVPYSSSKVQASVDRKVLLDTLRSSDKVTLSVTSKDLVDVASLTGSARMTVTGTTEGNGRVAVDSDRMRKLLTALPGRIVTIQFDEVQPGPVSLTTEEARGWLTMLAPVV